ncbi:GL12704 [Drosophila persimilis]|uniref:GL12704 n=1 Tax=Drosophila persimilis TaxID=7234 RepID=B4IRS1_DROPE|nr:GL12704 [Drosophila persimilis]
MEVEEEVVVLVAPTGLLLAPVASAPSSSGRWGGMGDYFGMGFGPLLKSDKSRRLSRQRDADKAA